MPYWPAPPDMVGVNYRQEPSFTSPEGSGFPMMGDLGDVVVPDAAITLARKVSLQHLTEVDQILKDISGQSDTGVLDQAAEMVSYQKYLYIQDVKEQLKTKFNITLPATGAMSSTDPLESVIVATHSRMDQAWQAITRVINQRETFRYFDDLITSMEEHEEKKNIMDDIKDTLLWAGLGVGALMILPGVIRAWRK